MDKATATRATLQRSAIHPAMVSLPSLTTSGPNKNLTSFYIPVNVLTYNIIAYFLIK